MLGDSASAQSGSILALAQVPSSRLTISAVAEIRFGSILPGAVRTIDPQTSPGAGRFEIRGAEGAEFELALSLPAELRSDGSPEAMPINFGPRAGCHREGAQPVGCQYYDPTSTITARFPTAAEPAQVFSVWLGATVQPAPDQTPGPYTGSVTASLAYTANE